MPAAAHDDTTTQRLDLCMFKMGVRRAGTRTGCRGAATLSGVRASEEKSDRRRPDRPIRLRSRILKRELRRDLAEAVAKAEASIRHWRPIDLATDVILNQP